MENFQKLSELAQREFTLVEPPLLQHLKGHLYVIDGICETVTCNSNLNWYHIFMILIHFDDTIYGNVVNDKLNSVELHFFYTGKREIRGCCCDFIKQIARRGHEYKSQIRNEN